MQSPNGMSIQDRIRAMNETLDKVEAAPSLELTSTPSEERTISTLESSADKVQQSALASEETKRPLTPSKRSSVVDMWRQKEGQKTPLSSPSATAERPKVDAGVRQVVVAPPFVQKRRSLVTSPVLTSSQDSKQDHVQENSAEEERNHQVVTSTVARSSWQPSQSPVPQAPVSLPKPLWVSSPKLKDVNGAISSQSPHFSAGGKNRFVVPQNNESGVPSTESVAQLLKSHLTTQRNGPQSPVTSVSQKKQENVVPSYKDDAPVDLTIVPSTNDYEADTRSTPGSRRSRVSDLVAVVSKHEQAQGSLIPEIHQTKSSSPSTDSTGARRSSVVDFWKTRTTQPTYSAVTDRPPAPANAPRKSTASASLKDIFEKRKEKETHSDGAEVQEDQHDLAENATSLEKTEAESEAVTTKVTDRWIQSTSDRFVEKNQDLVSNDRTSGIPRTSMAGLSSSLKDAFEKRKEKEIQSDCVAEHDIQQNGSANSFQQDGKDAGSETGTASTPIANRWNPTSSTRFVGSQQTPPVVAASSTDAANSHEVSDVTDTTSPQAISFKERARLFEEKSSQNRPALNKVFKVGHPFKDSGKLSGKPGSSSSTKSVTNRWTQNVVNKSSVHTNRIDNVGSSTAAPGIGRLPQVPPMHPKKGSPKSTYSLWKNVSRESAMAPEEGVSSTNWEDEDELSGPGMSSRLDPSSGHLRAAEVVASNSGIGPESSIVDIVAPEKLPRGAATHARSASTGSFGELLPDSIGNPTPSLKRHARIPSAGSIGELGARYRVSSIGSIGDVEPQAPRPTDAALEQNKGITTSKVGSHKKSGLSSRMIESLRKESKPSDSTGLQPTTSAVLPKPLRFQKTDQDGAGGKKDQSRNGDPLVSSKESAFDSWPSKSDEGTEHDGQSGSGRKRNRRNLASLGKRHLSKTLAQKPTNGDAYSLVSNPSSSMFSSQRSTQSQTNGMEGATKPSKAPTSDWSDNAWPSEGLDPMFSLSVDSGSPKQSEIPNQIVTKQMLFQGQHGLKDFHEGKPPSNKPSSTKSSNSVKFTMADVLDPIDEYQWSQSAMNNFAQPIPQPSEYTALHVSVSEPKWQSNSDLSFGMKPSLHSPGFEDNKSDFSVFSDSAVSKASSTSSLANRAERALQARRRKNRTHITTGKSSTMTSQEAHNAVFHSNQQNSAQSGPQLHTLHPENRLAPEEVDHRYDEAYAQSLTEKRRAAGLMTTYKTSSRFMEEDDEVELQSAPLPARKRAEDDATVESGESSYRTLETATSESESPWSKGHSKRRSVGPVPEKFIDESAENMDNFQKAFESLGLSQIASDLAREVRLATLDISNLAKGMNETVKTFRTPAYTRRSKAMVPKEDAPFDEDVAIEVEYLEDYADDDDESDSNPAISNGSLDGFGFGDQQRFEQSPSKGRGTKSAYV